MRKLTYLLNLMLLCFCRSDHYKIPLKKVPLNIYNKDYLQSSSSNYKTGKESIYNYRNMQYIGQIMLGKQKQVFDCLFDSGSGWLWVPTSQCTSCKSFAQNFYTCSSQTCDTSNTHSIQYGKGSNDAYVATDDVSFTNTLTIQNQKFLAVYSAADFSSFKGDGICGLGFESQSHDIPTFMDNFKNQGLIKERMFSFSLSYSENEAYNDNLSELIIGGYDQKFMTENFTYADVIDDYYWAVSLQTLSLGDQDIQVYEENNQQIRAIIDSGTSLIYFDYDTFDLIIENFENMGIDCQKSDQLQFYYCSGQNSDTGQQAQYPPLKITIAGKDMSIPATDYLYHQGEKKYLFILPMGSLGTEKRLALLGDMFMRRYYTVFNEDTKTIGFAKARIFSDFNLQIDPQTFAESSNEGFSISTKYIIGVMAIFLVLIILKYSLRSKKSQHALKESLISNKEIEL